MNEKGFRSDEELGYHVSLEDDREYQKGHTSFDLNSTDTEVTALQKILDGYFDTTGIDNISDFQNYKLEFSISFLDTICLIMREKVKDASNFFKELEDQLSDIYHRMTPGLADQQFTAEEKVELFDLQQDLLNKRRNVKDSIKVMQIILENAERSRNFIFGMNRRQYSAKSQRFSDDENYHYGAKDTIVTSNCNFHQQEDNSRTMVSIRVQK